MHGKALGRGGGGYSRFQVMGMTLGPKINHQKNPIPNFVSFKNLHMQCNALNNII